MIAALNIFGAVWRFIATVVKSLFESLSALISSPAAWFAVLALFTVGYGLGINRGMKIDAHLVQAAKQDRDQWKEAHAALLSNAKQVDRDDKSLFDKSMAAKREAEAAERAKAGVPLPLAQPVGGDPVAKRVRDDATRKAPARKDSGQQAGLCWLFVDLPGCK